MMSDTRWVVFLDIDGVLNSTQFMESILPSTNRSKIVLIDRRAVERLNRLCLTTGAQVVVSSTWRYSRTLAQLRNVLVDHGFEGTVLGMTPKMSSAPRGEEIQAWLDNAPLYGLETTRFIIIDDNAEDMLHLSDRLVQTLQTVGLQDADVDMAIDMLRKEPSTIVTPSREFIARFCDEG